jgi:hypothetical protein
MFKKKENSETKKIKDSLEVYIRPDGSLLLNNISRFAFSALKDLSKDLDKKDIYCG